MNPLGVFFALVVQIFLGISLVESRLEELPRIASQKVPSFKVYKAMLDKSSPWNDASYYDPANQRFSTIGRALLADKSNQWRNVISASLKNPSSLSNMKFMDMVERDMKAPMLLPNNNKKMIAIVSRGKRDLMVGKRYDPSRRFIAESSRYNFWNKFPVYSNTGLHRQE